MIDARIRLDPTHGRRSPRAHPMNPLLARTRRLRVWLGGVASAACLFAHGPSPARAAEPLGPTAAEARSAAEKALELIARSAGEYTKHRDCFSCHHQAMPVVALSLAKARGYAVDEATIRAQLEQTEADLAGASESYRKGQGQGGGVTRAGYALWTFEAGGWAPDETTALVVEYLLRRDDDRGGPWRTSSNRPPSEASSFTSTFVAIGALRAYATPEQSRRVASRIEAARDWLLRTPARDTEDRVFRLWGLSLASAPEPSIDQAARDLLAAQRDDGGWSQLDGQASDAYATGSALVALRQAARLPVTDPSYRRGLAFLVRTQLADGSWRVKSRSKPFQAYFESGFPHGADQFISIAASSWAAAALVLAGDATR
jgi:hypothetical protein